MALTPLIIALWQHAAAVRTLWSRRAFLLGLTTGYLLADFYLTRDEWLKKFSFSLHHWAGTGLAFAMWYVPTMRKWASLGYLVEISTVFLNLSWFARTLLGARSRLHLALSLAFAFAFLSLRVVYLPAICFHLRTSPRWRHHWARLGAPGELLVAAILLLQYHS